MDGDDLKIGAVRKFFPQLDHIDVHRPRPRSGGAVPKLIHQLGAGKGLFGVGKQLVDQIKLPHGQRNLLAVEVSGVFLGVQRQAADRQLFAGGNPGPAQQRLHPQQQLIYVSLKEENQKNMENGTYIKSNVIYTVNSLQNCDWHIVGVCYVDEMITNKVERVVSSLVVILAIVLAGTVFLGSVFSDLFSKPVTSLVRAMGEFEGNSAEFVYHPVTGTKEISALSDSFEHMAVRIQKLMEEVRQEEISLRKTELKALQAQINPHFLYNTLDAIAWMCEAGRNEDAVEMVNALARLFRISISRGHELIPIEKELQHAQSYLHIQNFRYKNQFRYQFDVDEACLSYYCNKITLQPIIENAIYHGMDRMVDEGMIRISIHQSEDKIIFTVEDNGVGMTEEQCEEVLKKERSDRAGIGIKNVNDRIKIYFGEEYGLTIKSELDEGTCVTIMMPKVTEGSYEDK